MKTKTFTVNPFQMNSYLYFCEDSREGVLIDPGYYTKNEQVSLLRYIDENSITVKSVLYTHGHVDHVMGSAFAAEVFGSERYIHREDLFLYNNAAAHGEFYGLDINGLPPLNNFFNDKSVIKVGNMELDIIHTPGHSPGGVCITDHNNRKVFCGDSVFRQSIGRTDLPGGDYNTLINSIQNKLFKLCSDEYELFPGHMEKTTIGDEKRNNPYLKT